MKTMIANAGNNIKGISTSANINKILRRLKNDQGIPVNNLKEIQAIIASYNNLPLLKIKETEQE